MQVRELIAFLARLLVRDPTAVEVTESQDDHSRTFELRVAAGREVHLGPLQPMALYAANSMFVGDYLTTGGQPPEDDYRMIEALRFEAVVDGVEA